MLLSDWKNNRTMNTKIMKTGLMTIVLCMLMIPMVSAQHTFSGKVTDENNVQLPGAQVVLSIGDSIYAAALTDANGAFSIRQIKTGTYDLSISFFGYTSLEEKRTINKSQRFVFSLVPEMSVELEKVEITGNRGDLVKRTATGQIFYLSEKAKNSGNPFLALREIPRLISNDALQSVKMEDGTQPLVLINGIAVNSGIAPIDPKDIESVEVVDVVDARYLRTGAKHILNIKLKKKIEPYRYFEVMNRYDLPDKQEMSALYFEVGNEKYSLYGRGAFDGLEKIIETRMDQKTIGFNADIRDKRDYNIGDVLKHALPQDFVKFGLIPEFIGRVPVTVSLDMLDRDALIRILQQPKNALTKQYQKLFELDGVALDFDKEALEAIADKALERKTGARGLRAIMEAVTLDLMYHIPSDEAITQCQITKEMVDEQLAIEERELEKIEEKQVG